MKSRNIPCTECRKHRRKCIRASPTSKCSRCERLAKICVQPTNNSPHNTKGDEHDADLLQSQVEELEWQIHQLEEQMKRLDPHTNNQNSGKNNSALAVISHCSNNKPASLLTQDMLQNLICNWKFNIKNGNIRIETGIRNISDLLSFQSLKNNISYLSPLSSNSSVSSFSSTTGNSNLAGASFDEAEQYRGGQSGFYMQFGTEAGELIPFTVRLLVQCAKKNYDRPASLLLPSILLLDPGVTINQLLSIYFSCHNVYSPLIHEKSFRQHYATIQDPMTDLISICLCCYVCSAPCDHFFFTPVERRSMADFFFGKAKGMILEQFDEREKRLENVIAINLLSKYMHMTLKFKECQKWIMMAYQILLDLREEYECTKASAAALGTLAFSPPLSPEETHVFTKLDPLPASRKNALEEMLFSRHASMTLCVRRLMDFVSNEIVDDSCFHFPRWQYLEDETEETKRFIHAQNWVMGLFNHPFIANFMKQIHRVHVGTICTLTFESIVRMEDVVKEWTSNDPNNLLIEEDLLDVEKCKAAIDKETDCIKLITFIHFHALLMTMYICLLQPIALGVNNEQILSFVQQRSLDNSLKGCRLLIYAVHRISDATGATSCHYALAASDYLFHAIDNLVLLSLSPNLYVAKEARAIMKDCLDEIEGINFMREHFVPRNSSPIFAGNMNFDDASTFNLEYYDQYPQPWFAMMFDASRYIASL